MKIRKLFKGIKPDKYSLKLEYDKSSKGRPAWIKVKGLPDDVQFIRIHLGRKGIGGKRIQTYRTYLIDGLFLPIDYTNGEMAKFYDKFSEVYDYSIKTKGKGVAGQNLIAANFLLNKLKKYIDKGEMLDLGAGTGLITELFVKEGFYPATLVDYSKGMLEKAKTRKGLKGCKFIQADIRNLNLNKKYDLILSFFSFGSDSYFSSEELDKILGIAKKHLKHNGIFAVLGHTSVDKFGKYFKKLDSGIYDLSTRNKFYTDYFIGRAK
ncbi:MAG TPA: class I SAM-dependent methyltransferase [Candidatus Paceibacterota bacterium]|nr:class I SAM-dependent methyltransferase [Candidatus Paceibacterota bacterium]